MQSFKQNLGKESGIVGDDGESCTTQLEEVGTNFEQTMLLSFTLSGMAEKLLPKVTITMWLRYRF